MKSQIIIQQLSFDVILMLHLIVVSGTEASAAQVCIYLLASLPVLCYTPEPFNKTLTLRCTLVINNAIKILFYSVV